MYNLKNSCGWKMGQGRYRAVRRTVRAVGKETGRSLGRAAGRLVQTQTQNWWVEGGFLRGIERTV